MLCQAAVCIESDLAHFPGGWDEAGRYRAESIQYLSLATQLHPEAERAKFWADVIRTDAAIDPLRKSRKFRELDSRVGRVTHPHLSEKDRTHEVTVPSPDPTSLH